MAQQQAEACVCGCSEHFEHESQLVCADCGRTLAEVQLSSSNMGPGGGNLEDEGFSFVPMSSDGSHLCAPVKPRPPARLSALKAKVEYLTHLLALPQAVLDEARATLEALCARTFQKDSDGTRACVALFVASRIQQFPITLRTLCQHMKVGVPEASKCLQRYNRRNDVPCPLLQPEELISRCVHQHAAANKLSNTATKVTLKLATRLLAFSLRHITTSSPLWQAAACVLLAIALATHTQPTAPVSASLDLGINHRTITQRQLPALISAIRAHAQHSPIVPTATAQPTPRTVAQADLQTDLQSPIPARSPSPAPERSPRLASVPAGGPPSPWCPPSQSRSPLQDHARRADNPGSTTPTTTCRPLTAVPVRPPSPRPQPAENSAVNSAVNSPGDRAGNTHPAQEAGPPGAGEPHATPGATRPPAPPETDASALGCGVKRRAGDDAGAASSGAEQLPAPPTKAVARPRSVLGDVWRSGAHQGMPEWLGGGDTALTLSVVQGVLDVDECLALCHEAAAAR